MVVALEDVEELGEDGQVAGGVLISHRADERLHGQQAVEEVGGPQVERLSLVKGVDLATPRLELLGERMRRQPNRAPVHDAIVHVACQIGERTAVISPRPSPYQPKSTAKQATISRISSFSK